MKGDGFYDANSSGQRAAIDALQPWIIAAAGQISIPSTATPMVLADYGSSEGRNALNAFRQAIETLRDRGVQNPLCPIFSDLPTNDFNQLSRNLTENEASFSAAQGIFPAAIGRSFYGPVLAPTSVHLGMSFNAVLWLDKLPSEPLDDFVVYLGPKLHRPDVGISVATAAAFAKAAARDLDRFYECRAVELAPGARLLLAQPGRDQNYCTGQGLYDLLHDAALDLVEQGKLDRTAYARVTMPIYFRTQEELLAPIHDSHGIVHDDFVVERAETVEVTVPFAADYARTQDVETYSEGYVGFAQAFTEPILRAGLDKSQGPEIVPAIYRQMRQLLIATPAKYAFRYLQCAALLARR
jgi:hypothetical protein